MEDLAVQKTTNYRGYNLTKSTTSNENLIEAF